MKKFTLPLIILILTFSLLLIPNRRAQAALCTSNGSGNWTNPTTWAGCGGNYPGQTTNDYVQILSGHTVTVDNNIPAIYYLEIQNGGAVVMNSSTSLAFSASGGTPGMSLASGGSFTMPADATIYFNTTYGSAGHTISGSFSFSKIHITGVGVNFGSNSTVTGELVINLGGFVSTNAPTYANNSTLRYNTGGTYVVGSEWFANVDTGQGVPFNVVATASTSLTFGTANRTLRGDLTLENSSTLNGASGHTLKVLGSVNTLTSSTLNAPNLLEVGGNWNLNNGTFNHNSKTVKFNGSAPQQIVDTSYTTSFYDLEIAAGSTLIVSNPSSTDMDVINQITNNGTLQQTLYVATGDTVDFLNIDDGIGNMKYWGLTIYEYPDQFDMQNTTVKIRGNSVCTTNDTSGHVHRCFDISPTTTANAEVTFYYLESERNSNTSSDVSVWHWSGGSWQKETGTHTYGIISPDYYSVTVDDVDNYSPFLLDDVNPGSPTAITLNKFTAQTVPISAWVFARGLGMAALLLGGLAALRRKRG
ncbi:MAG: hypothetical protein Fur0022_45330 [Anaerolineales bacterium]